MSMNLIVPLVVFNNVDISVNQVSSPIHVMYSDNIGVQVVWTGTPTGTFGMDISNTAVLGANGGITGGTWTPLVFSSPSAPSPAGSSGNGFLVVSETPAAFIRLNYTAASGSGRCTATLTAKPI